MATLDHIHIHAADPLATERFFCSTLGADRVGALPSGEGGDNVLLLLGGQFVVVSAFPEGHSPERAPEAFSGRVKAGFGVAHFGLNVPNLDDLLARLAEAGIEPHAPPRQAGPVRYAYFSAPDGVVIEATEYVLPAHLAPAAAALRGFDGAVHALRRLVGSALVAASAG